MPYQSDDDPLVETLNSAVWHVIGVGIGLVLAVFVFVWQKVTGRQTSPATLEGEVPVAAPTSEQDHPHDSSVLVYGLLLGGALLVLLGLLIQRDFAWLFIVGGLVSLGAAFHVDQGHAKTHAQPVAPAQEPLAAPRRYRITLPRDASFEPEAARKLMEYLLRTSVHLALQIVAEHQSIHWEITDWRTGAHPEYVRRAIHTHYPKAEVEWFEVKAGEEDYPYYRYVIFYQQAAEFVWPIKRSEE